MPRLQGVVQPRGVAWKVFAAQLVQHAVYSSAAADQDTPWLLGRSRFRDVVVSGVVREPDVSAPASAPRAPMSGVSQEVAASAVVVFLDDGTAVLPVVLDDLLAGRSGRPVPAAPGLYVRVSGRLDVVDAALSPPGMLLRPHTWRVMDHPNTETLWVLEVLHVQRQLDYI